MFVNVDSTLAKDIAGINAKKLGIKKLILLLLIKVSSVVKREISHTMLMLFKEIGMLEVSL